MAIEWPSVIDKALDKVPVDKLYEDLFQPGVKKAGEALETVLDLSNTILFPVKLLNAKVRLIYKHNIDKYEAKLQASNNELIQVPPAIGIPITDKLLYLDQEELAEAFINLLTKASFKETIHLVHPSFVSILENISVDEAKLLFAIRHMKYFPLIEFEMFFSKNNRDLLKNLSSNLTGLEKKCDLAFPNNIELYFINLEKLGIIVKQRSALADAGQGYSNLKDLYKDDYIKCEEYLNEYTSNENTTGHLEVREYYMFITKYGKEFIDACINDIGEIQL